MGTCGKFINTSRVDELDLKKAIILFGAFCLFAPVAGFLIRRRPYFQRFVFLVMCYLSISGLWHAQEWGLTINSLWYRGTARGFHFYWAEVAAVALIFAQMLGGWRRFRFLPPGLWLYFLYIALSFVSIINAEVPLYTWFAVVKAVKMSVVFVAAYNFFRTEGDMRFGIFSLGVVVLCELVAVLNQKYVQHIYQVWGTFEHQNSLCMFTILVGMVFLAAAMGPKQPLSNFYLLVFVASAAIVQSTLSRAGLAIFAFGTMMVVFLSLLDQPTKRRLSVLTGLGCVALLGLYMTMDTIVQRFNDYGNQESANTREMLNISSRMMLTDYPLGAGWNNFAHLINKPYPYGDHIDRWQIINGNPVDPDYKKGVVESLWWLLLSETGYQGFASFVLFIGVFLWWNVRNMLYFRKRTLGAISIGLLVGTSMNYLQSILERVLTQPRNAIFWLILLAATARIMVWRKQEIKVRRRLWRIRRAERMRKRFPMLPEHVMAA